MHYVVSFFASVPRFQRAYCYRICVRFIPVKHNQDLGFVFGFYMGSPPNIETALLSSTENV